MLFIVAIIFSVCLFCSSLNPSQEDTKEDATVINSLKYENDSLKKVINACQNTMLDTIDIVVANKPTKDTSHQHTQITSKDSSSKQ